MIYKLPVCTIISSMISRIILHVGSWSSAPHLFTNLWIDNVTSYITIGWLHCKALER